MATTASDNIQCNAPKVLDNRSGRFQAGKWRPWNTVQEYLDTMVLLSRAETQEFYVRSTTNANRADLYIIDKNGSPYKFLPEIDLSNYYTKGEANALFEGLQVQITSQLVIINQKEPLLPVGVNGQYLTGEKIFKDTIDLPLSKATVDYMEFSIEAIPAPWFQNIYIMYDGTNNRVRLDFIPIQLFPSSLNGSEFIPTRDFLVEEDILTILYPLQIGTNYSITLNYLK